MEKEKKKLKKEWNFNQKWYGIDRYKNCQKGLIKLSS